jgi:hypothetical protein
MSKDSDTVAKASVVRNLGGMQYDYESRRGWEKVGFVVG